jgi:hypothetical protein
MLFFVLFGWLRRLCGVIFGGQWVFLVERRKRKSRSRDRGYVGEIAVNGAGQTDKKQSGLTLRQRKSKNDNTQTPKEDTYCFLVQR